PPGAATAIPDSTRCSRPWSRSSILTASSRSRGFPRTSPSTTTIVSHPITRASGRSAATAAAFARASRSANSAGRQAPDTASSTAAGWTVKSSESIRRSSARRGEAEARTSGGEPGTSSFQRPDCVGTGSPLQDQGHGPVVDELDIHHRTELTGFDRARRTLAKDLDEAVVEPHGDRGRRGVDEARAPAAARIAVQRELAHDQQAAPDLLESEVHLSLGIREEPEADDLVRHPVDLLLAVALGEADEEEEATADLARGPTVDRPPGTGDHRLYPPHPLNCSVPDYSTVTDFARFLGWSTLQPRMTAMW